jgi:hypothetical protein
MAKRIIAIALGTLALAATPAALFFAIQPGAPCFSTAPAVGVPHPCGFCKGGVFAFRCRASQYRPSYFPISTSMNVLFTGLGRGVGLSGVGGTGSFFSVLALKMWCVFVSMPMVRAP